MESLHYASLRKKKTKGKRTGSGRMSRTLPGGSCYQAKGEVNPKDRSKRKKKLRRSKRGLFNCLRKVTETEEEKTPLEMERKMVDFGKGV